MSARKTQFCNIKIIQASVRCLSSGKLEFSPQNQTFVDVTETTPILHYVSSAVQRKWGQEYTLVMSDGLKVDNSSGTKGRFLYELQVAKYENLLIMILQDSNFGRLAAESSML